MTTTPAAQSAAMLTEQLDAAIRKAKHSVGEKELFSAMEKLLPLARLALQSLRAGERQAVVWRVGVDGEYDYYDTEAEARNHGGSSRVPLYTSPPASVRHGMEIAAEIKRLQQIEHLVWHLLEDSEEREGEQILNHGDDFSALLALLPEDHPRAAATKLPEGGDAKVMALQARIDELMLEYCPDEMTPEQIENWKRHQKAIPEDAAMQHSPAPEGK